MTDLIKTVALTDIPATRYCRDEYIAKRARYAGCVLAVADKRESVQVMSDVWELQTIRTVEVWDAEQGKAIQFVSDCFAAYEQCVSAYSVDSTPEVRKAHIAWLFNVELPRLAELEAATVRARWEAELDANLREALYGLRKGNQYTVVKGRKHPRGTTGILVWFGTNRFGPTCMLATSDRRDASGRYADILWINPDNLEASDNAARKQAVAQIEAARAVIDQRVREHCDQWLATKGYECEVYLGRRDQERAAA